MSHTTVYAMVEKIPTTGTRRKYSNVMFCPVWREIWCYWHSNWYKPTKNLYLYSMRAVESLRSQGKKLQKRRPYKIGAVQLLFGFDWEARSQYRWFKESAASWYLWVRTLAFLGWGMVYM